MGWNLRRRADRRRRGRGPDGSDCLDCGDVGCDCLSLLGTSLVLTVAGAGRVAPTTTGSLPSRLATRLVRSYQVNVSSRRGPVCNLTPSCSNYGLQVLGEHGAWRGARLIRARLVECRQAGVRRRTT